MRRGRDRGAGAVLPLALLAALAWPAGPAAGESAREIVKAMIDAHGGMERWASAPTVSWVEEFIPAGEESGRPMRVVVEQGRRRVYQDAVGVDMSLAWDGEKAWSVNWQGQTPPRFLALLTYHFLNLPWLANDPGVRLGAPAPARLFDDPKEYIGIKITYEEGVGDTPNDYYLLYIDPDSYRLRACEYIVTYQALLPEGRTATDPNTLVYDRYETIDGLVLPTHFTIYRAADRSLFYDCEIHGWSFSEPFDEARMTMPEGAVVDRSQP